VNIEWKILLICARTTLDSFEHKKLLELCQQNVNWTDLFELAYFHRTQGLVYIHLKDVPPGAIPKHCLQQLKETILPQTLQSLAQSTTLVKALDILCNNGIMAIPFKGPVFTKKYYGNETLRNYCDLDILIAPHEIYAAVTALQEIGCVPSFPLNKSQLEVLAKTDNEYPLYLPKQRICIDLQWELTGGYTGCLLTLNNFVENLKTIQFMGKSVSVFGEEDLLVYLCIHGNQHIWAQLDQVCCIAELIKKNDNIDWTLVWHRATELKVIRIVSVGLLLVSNLLSVELPPDIAAEIRKDRRAMVLATERTQKLSAPLSEKTNSLTSRRFSRFHWLSLDSGWQAFRYGCHIIFVPTRYDWQTLPLPVWLSPLHYIYRPFRLLFASSKILLRQIMKN
jgi:hypothetical protein